MSYLLPADDDNHPVRIAARLLRLAEFQHLVDGEAAIDYIFRTEQLIDQQRRVLGTMCMPRVNGRLSSLFDWMLEDKLGRMPDFLMIIDHGFWFDEAGPVEREILVYHELCHAAQAIDAHGGPRFTRDGVAVWAIKGHDIEEFNAVVSRYGAWKDDIKAFLEAAGEHRDDMMTPGRPPQPADRPLN